MMFGWRRKSDSAGPAASDRGQPAPVRAEPEPSRVAPKRRPSASAVADDLHRYHAGGYLGDGIDGGERLGYAEGAAQFLEWLQQVGETGELSKPYLHRLYVRHCAERGYAMLPDNYFFGALARLARRHERRLARRDGGRKRVTTYDIPRKRTAAPGAGLSKSALPRGPQSRPHDDEQDEAASATRRAA
jgi:hypothetical protein